MEARNKIQGHLSGTLQEIFDTERSLHLLKRAIDDKIDPLKVMTRIAQHILIFVCRLMIPLV